MVSIEPPALPGRDPAELARLLEEAKKVRGNSLFADAMKRYRKNRASRAALWLLALIGLVSLLTPVLPLAAPAHIDLSRQYEAPSLSPLTQGGWKLEENYKQDSYDPLTWLLIETRASVFGETQIAPLLGTDGKGRCLLSRILWGGRISLLVGIAATLVSLLIGVTYGAVSGFLGGWIDNLLMRLVDMMYSIPFIFVVIFVITMIRGMEQSEGGQAAETSRLVVFFAVIGAIYWLTMARVVRGQVLSLKEKEFVEAARVLGGGTMRILRKHIVPNVFSVVLVYLTLTIPRVMLFEAFLSFLGLGVQAPDVSWGMLAADGIAAVNAVRVYWWFVLFPGLALGLTLLALNFLGDGLRDALDPRLKDA